MTSTNLTRREDRIAGSKWPLARGRKPISTSRWLVRRVWLLMIFVGVVFIVSEVIDHSRMHQAHASGLSLAQDAEFLREVFTYGVVVPILTGLLLTRLERIRAQRDMIVKEVEERRAFVNQMNEAADWDRLADLVVSFPGSVTAASNVYFMVQQEADDKFDLISEWHRPGSDRSLALPMIPPAECEECAATKQGNRSAVMTCRREGIDAPDDGVTRYCMCLVAGESRKAVLAFDLRNFQTIDDQQKRILGDLGPEMAMAIDNTLLLQHELNEANTTKTERLRIARYLHDNLGQNLSFLRLKLDQLSAKDTEAEIDVIRQEIENMRDVANEAYDQMRGTLSDLRDIDRISLQQALRIYTDTVAARSNFDLQLISKGKPRNLPPHIQRQVLYVTREALNNVEKHAQAKQVNVHLNWSEGELEVIISDDGIGFHPETVTEEHYGLIIMKERARSLDAELRVASTLGAGTDVVLRLPIPVQADNDDS